MYRCAYVAPALMGEVLFACRMLPDRSYKVRIKCIKWGKTDLYNPDNWDSRLLVKIWDDNQR